MVKNSNLKRKIFDGQRKIRRIIEIMNMLDSNREVSIEALSRQLNVTKRTIQRDLNFIEMNYPLIRPKKGYVSFVEGVGLKKKEISPSQKAALMMVMEVARNLGGYMENAFSQLIKHILGSGNIISEIMPIMPARIENTEKNNLINEISNAIAFNHVLKIRYFYNDKREEEKEICPLKILFSEGFLYLLAFPYNQKNSYRTYRIDRIKKCETLSGRFFNTPSNLDKIISTSSILGIKEGKKIDIELKIEKWAIDYFKTFKVVNNQRITENKDGSITLKGEIRQFQEILPYILRWIPYVIVIKPKELKKEIEGKIKEYLRLL